MKDSVKEKIEAILKQPEVENLILFETFSKGSVSLKIVTNLEKEEIKYKVRGKYCDFENESIYDCLESAVKKYESLIKDSMFKVTEGY